jgi:hypothetical protein
VRAALGRHVSAARGAVWAVRACAAAHRQLKTVELAAIDLPPVPGLPRSAGRGAQAVLRRSRWSCLQRALVRQRWLAAHGEPRDLLIGVQAGPPISAHAWLEGDPDAGSEGFAELSRHPA